ncbi:hypothetical protein E4T39_06920 [Aureobasidium subglaciale]|nr:hypothetical protein E4T39_06920 [Aureobasidium subglaciale]
MLIFGTLPITSNLDSLYSPCLHRRREIWRAFRSMLLTRLVFLASGRSRPLCKLPSFQHARLPSSTLVPSSSRVSSATHCTGVDSIIPTAHLPLPVTVLRADFSIHRLPNLSFDRLLGATATLLDSTFYCLLARYLQHDLQIGHAKSACVRGPHGPPPLSRLLQIELWAD